MYALLRIMEQNEFLYRNFNRFFPMLFDLLRGVSETTHLSAVNRFHKTEKSYPLRGVPWESRLWGWIPMTHGSKASRVWRGALGQRRANGDEKVLHSGEFVLNLGWIGSLLSSLFLYLKRLLLYQRRKGLEKFFSRVRGINLTV
jgi:hypothetical protein